VQELVFHRSFSHSLLFVVLGGGVFAYASWKLFKWEKLTLKDLFWVFSLCFLTHILLDTCTTWGTQLLWPFTSYGYAFYNVFVVDPFYTVPFIGFLIAVMFFNRSNPWRARLNWMGIGLSTAYLITGLLLQQHAKNIFQENLRAQGIEVEQMITKTTPFNIILWTCSAKTAQGYYTGFYSFLDADEHVTFEYEPAHTELIAPYTSYAEVQTLLKVSKGYYTVEEIPGGVLMNDLRFGKFNGWQGEEKGEYVFKYEIKPVASGELSIEQINYRKPINKAYLTAFYQRIWGDKLKE
jgi:inner membrane protein